MTALTSGELTKIGGAEELQYGPRIAGSVVGPEVEAVTIKLVPRA